MNIVYKIAIHQNGKEGDRVRDEEIMEMLGRGRALKA